MTIPPLIPIPAELALHDGAWSAPSTLQIACDAASAPAAERLATTWGPALGRERLAVVGPFATQATIHLRVDATAFPATGAAGSHEGYQLTITPTAIHIRAASRSGALHAVHTLLQLGERRGDRMHAPCLTIADRPRFPWRGVLIDVGRYVLPVAAILRLLERMAERHLNVLHWHLTEDAGWRLELPGFPALTEVAAWRGSSQLNHWGDPQYRSDGVPHGGFYTADDVRLVVAHAARLGITVVPEIDLPGHVQAVLAAYPELGSGAPATVSERWMIQKRILHPHERTLTWMANVLNAVMDLFPSPWLHVGGDEVPRDEWRAPELAPRLAQLGIADAEGVQPWWTRWLAAHCAKRGRRLIGWDEILDGGAPADAVVMAWRDSGRGVIAAQTGHDVIMAPQEDTYFNYRAGPVADDVAMRHDACEVSLARVIAFDPVPEALRGTPAAAHVLGTQACLWGEYLPDEATLLTFAEPRLTALAEAAWSSLAARAAHPLAQRLAAARMAHA